MYSKLLNINISTREELHCQSNTLEIKNNKERLKTSLKTPFHIYMMKHIKRCYGQYLRAHKTWSIFPSNNLFRRNDQTKKTERVKPKDDDEMMKINILTKK
ncbi:hypothetical protein HELRODRAFT_164814 [Helobdella robusta]|uniref:Uncharacterized protein n=1 Tax=Helobdella robusta TaxID=6412 RepID=T1EVU4_HELRO|nr:hypothetical protein HELRODRAFT_164814 [Helobdella robusta]ESN92718.1 hypothetical protein HELRODRAFT_164814 [Helobdella robusta]